MSRLLRDVVLALSLFALIAFVPPPVARAADDLRVVAATEYRLVPAEGRVHVTVDAAATSFTPNSPDGSAFTGLEFTVQPGVANVSASSAGTALQTVVKERTAEYTAIGLTFSRPVFYRQSYRYQVDFDLVDRGGGATRDIRISRSLIAFPLWAFGSDGVAGSSVQVSVPPGYSPSVEGAHLASTRSADGGTTLSSGVLSNPFAFFAYLSADRPGAFVETPFSLAVGGARARVDVLAWEDDPAWGVRMKSLLTDGLPALHDLIGLDYAVTGPLKVEEAATSRLGEYAGIYNDVNNLITVRYDADAFVSLHEAAHIWFNEKLFDDRWIGEAWAEFYAVRAGKQIHASGESFNLDPGLLAHRIPLNNWGVVGAENLPVEDFAYAASYNLANLIARRTDIKHLQAVWQAAAGHQLAYQPMHLGTRPDAGPITQAGWQRLLDLLEERTGANYDDLWKEWVANPQQRVALELRARVRTAYQLVATQAASWNVPRALRLQMSSWQFTEAQAQLDGARRVLAQRGEISARAQRLDLKAPPTLRAAFEGDRGMNAAEAEGRAELSSLDAISLATAAQAPPPTPLEWVGLLGVDPARALGGARTAFESGDLAAASASAGRARSERLGSVEAGRERVVALGGGILGLDGLAMAGLGLRRRRHRRRRVALAATRLATPQADPPPPGAAEVDPPAYPRA